MGNTSFVGPVRSQQGYKQYSVNATTGVETEITIVDSDGNLYSSFTTGITAFATGGQASGTALTTRWNNVTTCATAGGCIGT